MSSSGSSVSSQSSDHPAAALAHLRSSILGRMSSEPGTSSSGNAAQGASTHVRRNRASSGNGSATRVPTFTPNLSDGRSLEQPTWSEFLREGPTTLRGADLSSDTHRRTQIALDRKRSFTASAQDSGRRRTVSGGFHNRHTGGHSPQLDGPSSPHRAVWPRRTESIDQSQENYFDLTTSPPAPHPRPSPFSSVRPGLLNARQYVLPKWQPDSDASKCPICKRQFGVFFRRHHCRKCGRVVCNDCSPHRITIPRQFIVHPPDQSQIPSRPSQVPIETIDLTEDGDRGGSSSIFTTETSISNPALGGGEKVRLCNPCVPDPQPSPHPDDSLTRSSATSSTGWTAGADGLMPSRNGNSFALPTSADLYHETLSDQASEMRRQRRRGMIIQQENDDLDALLTGPESATPERAPPHGIFNHTVRDNISRRDRPPSYQSYNNTVMSPPGYHVSTSSLTSNRPGDVQSGSVGSASDFLPPHLRRPSGAPLPMHGHSRYQSLDTASRPSPSTMSRPRVRSMLDVDPSLRGYISHASSSAPRPPIESRPRLHERDICPVCRRALPPLGADGNDTARVAHIAECINTHALSTSHSSSSRNNSMVPVPPRAPIVKVPFIASEKDCVNEDGSAQECSICFEEYEVGDEMARLECFCKFHRVCIDGWFTKKQECPTHKIA